MSDSLTAQEAAVELHALINSRARNPRLEEITAIVAKVATQQQALNADQGRESLARIREAIARLEAAEHLRMDTDDADAHRQYDERKADLSALEAQIPIPPRSFSDILARAEIAYSWDCFEDPAVRLIEAVLQYGGRCHD